MCQTVKRNRPKLFRQVARVLYDHDPEGIYLSGRGAYDNETGELCLELRHCRTASDVQALVARVFVDQFGPAEPGKYQRIAFELSNFI